MARGVNGAGKKMKNEAVRKKMKKRKKGERKNKKRKRVCMCGFFCLFVFFRGWAGGSGGFAHEPKKLPVILTFSFGPPKPPRL